jgi:hypothetical protein
MINRFFSLLNILLICFLLVVLTPSICFSSSNFNFQEIITESHIQKIKNNLILRELGRNGLIDWNPTEDFASLGIMHATWGGEKTIKHGNTFSKFVIFSKSKGISIPMFLNNSLENPWKSRSDFFASKYSFDIRMQELQIFLNNTVDLQVEFLIDRVLSCLTLFLNQLDSYSYEKIALKQLISSSDGLLAVIDYINFKGEGDFNDESKWGLFNVLSHMKNFADKAPLDSFINSAKLILKLRHPKYNLYANGWNSRLESYANSMV